MKKIISACAFVLLEFWAGCQTTTVEPVSSADDMKVERGATFYVVTPRDGSYGGTQYQGSGATVAGAFDAALSRYAESVIVGLGGNSNAETVAIAKTEKCAYVLIPKITKWEDRATEWSGKRDKMELFVRVLNVESGAEVASAEIVGRSAWATFGGDHPDDLVKTPVQEFVASLF